MLRATPGDRCVGDQMRTITALTAKSLGKFLAKDFQQIFGSAQEDRAERLSSLARSTMECLGRTMRFIITRAHTACDVGLVVIIPWTRASYVQFQPFSTGVRLLYEQTLTCRCLSVS